MDEIQRLLKLETVQRVIFGVLLVGLTLLVLRLGVVAFVCYVLLISALMLREWFNIVRGFNPPLPMRAVLGASLIVLCGASAIAIDLLYGLLTIVWALALVWATDIGAYVVGRRVGGAKFAPKISPNKTWSGVIGGVVSALMLSLIWHGIAGDTLPTASVPKLLWVSFGASVASILGDLFESQSKRLANVKDAGSLIPGHGGVLDRLDGAMFALPFVCLSLLGGRLI